MNEIIARPTDTQTALPAIKERPPLVFHRWPSAALTESVVTGAPVVALCGKRDAGGATILPGSPRAGRRRSIVCPVCDAIYTTMRA